MFQSTHPHGVRLWSVVKPKEEEKVSIHAPTRGATPSPGPWTASGPSFNPRTHTGCDFIRFRISISSSVSIHAPTRGATSNDNCFLNATRVSIHAPTRGATDRYVWPVNSSLFQSTHPHGVRRTFALPFSFPNEFQSTHPHGVRPFSSSLVQDVKSFNPRTHTGCDHQVTYLLCLSTGFNPRTHTGCDAAQTKKSSADMFQSTHPHGVRPPPTEHDRGIRRFQSTHPHGVRRHE